MRKLSTRMILVSSIFFTSCSNNSSQQETLPNEVRTKWSVQRTENWYNKQSWLLGSNFNPSTSINQLEFWMAETWDPVTIDRELGWAEDLGMNLMRVYLHNLIWEYDKEGFINRLNEYLEISSRHNINTMFVLLDDVWNPTPIYGKQPEPIPHIHNSGWVQSPGSAILGDTSRHDELESYIKGILSEFRSDERVLLWDLYNEPDNVSGNENELTDKQFYSLALLKKVVRWARDVNPEQPLTAGIWRGNIQHWGIPDSLPPVDRFMIENSDIITFHAYDGNIEDVKEKIAQLRNYNRPLICTEYLARGNGNRFENVMALLKDENIGAINWGLVDGKTQTKYPWSSWREKMIEEPELWHHDIFRSDGAPYNHDEVKFIKSMSGKN